MLTARPSCGARHHFLSRAQALGLPSPQPPTAAAPRPPFLFPCFLVTGCSPRAATSLRICWTPTACRTWAALSGRARATTRLWTSSAVGWRAVLASLQAAGLRGRVPPGLAPAGLGAPCRAAVMLGCVLPCCRARPAPLLTAALCPARCRAGRGKGGKLKGEETAVIDQVGLWAHAPTLTPTQPHSLPCAPWPSPPGCAATSHAHARAYGPCVAGGSLPSPFHCLLRAATSQVPLLSNPACIRSLPANPSPPQVALVGSGKEKGFKQANIKLRFNRNPVIGAPAAAAAAACARAPAWARILGAWTALVPTYTAALVCTAVPDHGTSGRALTARVPSPSPPAPRQATSLRRGTGRRACCRACLRMWTCPSARAPASGGAGRGGRRGEGGREMHGGAALCPGRAGMQGGQTNV